MAKAKQRGGNDLKSMFWSGFLKQAIGSNLADSGLSTLNRLDLRVRLSYHRGVGWGGDAVLIKNKKGHPFDFCPIYFWCQNQTLLTC